MKQIYNKRFCLSTDSAIENMAVNGSETPQVFEISPDAGDTLEIARILFYVEDTGAFDAEKWGNGITLTTGLKISLVNDHGGNRDLLGFNVKTSGDLCGMCFDVNHLTFGTGNEILGARFTFTKFGAPIVLSSSRGDKLQITVNDDMTGIVAQYVLAQGIFSKGLPDFE